MALRKLQIIAPDQHEAELRKALADLPPDRHWLRPLKDDRVQASVLLQAEEAEALIDALATRFGAAAGLRMVLLPVEATLPPITAPPPEDEHAPDQPRKRRVARIGRDELLVDIGSSSRITPAFLTLTALSTVVAAGGMLRDNLAVIIGAMVIAPLLGPNVALALGTTLGDPKLVRSALRANIAGVAVALAIATPLGLIVSIDPESEQLVSRTIVGLPDLALALASGAAGVLAFTGGAPATLVGVMVAVALLPPTVAVGLLLGSGYFEAAARAATLLAANVVCVNLAGVVTFLAQGVGPQHWWQDRSAKRAVRRAVALWLALLAILIALLLLAPRIRSALLDDAATPPPAAL